MLLNKVVFYSLLLLYPFIVFRSFSRIRSLKSSVIDTCTNILINFYKNNLTYTAILSVGLLFFKSFAWQGILCANFFALFVYFNVFMGILFVLNYVLIFSKEEDMDSKIKYNSKMLEIAVYGTALVISLVSIGLPLIVISKVLILFPKIKKDCFFISLMFNLFLLKSAGNFITKIGDIVADYHNKVIQDNKEDESLDVFSMLDNVGDIIGDCFGYIVDFFGCFVVLYYMIMKTGKSIDICNLLGLSSAHIMMYVMTFCLIKLMSSRFKFMEKFASIDKVFLSMFSFVMIVLATISTGILRDKSFFSMLFKKGFFQSENVNLLYRFGFMLAYAVIAIIPIFICRFVATSSVQGFIMRSMFRAISSIRSLYIVQVFAVTFLLSLLLFVTSEIIVSTIASFLFFKKMSIESIYQIKSFRFSIKSSISQYIYSGNFALMSMIVFLFYCMKSLVGVLADSSGGLYKKIKQETQVNESKSKIVEHDLEVIDVQGNIFKMEARIILVYFAILLAGVMHPPRYTYNNYMNYYLCISLTLLFLDLCSELYNSVYQQKIVSTERKSLLRFIIDKGTTYSAIFILIVSNIVLTGYESLFVCNTFYFALFASLFGSVFGGFMDMMKKDYYRMVDKPGKIALIEGDLIGDYAKDVFSPTMFSISLMAALLLMVKI